jgi:hypothetical protein
LAAPLAFLVACSLLAIFAAAASASNYDMRGEWSIELTATEPGKPPLPGTDVIDKMEANGEYSGTASFLGGILIAPVTGTVTNNEASIEVVAATPLGIITFRAKELPINTTENKFSGAGTYYNSNNEPYETGEVICARTKTYQEVIERRERERKEAEERAERANIRGEWELTLKFGGNTSKAIALITNEADSKNVFASSSLTFEGGVSGSIEGTLEGEKATIKLTSDKSILAPAAEFTSSAMSVTPATDPASITGSGKVVVPELSFEMPGELTATRLHTYTEVTERETREREAEEAKKAEEARQAKLQAEKEAEEATNKRIREEREARERLEGKPPSSTVPAASPTVLAASPLGTSLTVTGAGPLPLRLNNPNAFSIHGRVTVVSSSAVGARHSGKKGKARQMTLGTASFTIAAHASETVSLKLSRTGLAALKRHRTLHVTVVVTSEAGGKSSTKSYAVTLHLRHGKG